MRRFRCGTWVSAAIGFCAAAAVQVIFGCGREPSSDAAPPATVRVAATSRPAGDPEEGPVALFERCCASCHGPQGSLYGDKLARSKDGSLGGAILNMMETQARLDPTTAMLDAMTAYHRAIRDRQPFLCVTNSAAVRSGKTTILRGEATPDVRVAIVKGDTSVEAERTGTAWTIANPPEPPFRLIARTVGVQVGFEYPDQTFSTGAR